MDFTAIGKDLEMGIQELLENLIYVELPSNGQEISDELKTVNETVTNKSDCDVIVDFTKVEIINSWNISNLLILRSLLEEKGRQLILCNVCTISKCVFVVAGLAGIFVFVDDKASALEIVKNAESLVSGNPSDHQDL